MEDGMHTSASVGRNDPRQYERDWAWCANFPEPAKDSPTPHENHQIRHVRDHKNKNVNRLERCTTSGKEAAASKAMKRGKAQHNASNCAQTFNAFPRYSIKALEWNHKNNFLAPRFAFCVIQLDTLSSREAGRTHDTRPTKRESTERDKRSQPNKWSCCPPRPFRPRRHAPRTCPRGTGRRRLGDCSAGAGRGRRPPPAAPRTAAGSSNPAPEAPQPRGGGQRCRVRAPQRHELEEHAVCGSAAAVAAAGGGVNGMRCRCNPVPWRAAGVQDGPGMGCFWKVCNTKAARRKVGRTFKVMTVRFSASVGTGGGGTPNLQEQCGSGS